jgi:serine/threonine protein phosphatase PrpC
MISVPIQVNSPLPSMVPGIPSFNDMAPVLLTPEPSSGTAFFLDTRTQMLAPTFPTSIAYIGHEIDFTRTYGHLGIESSYYTGIGRKDKPEDAFSLSMSDPQTLHHVVCDGMGGAQNSEIASRLIARDTATRLGMGRDYGAALGFAKATLREEANKLAKPPTQAERDQYKAEIEAEAQLIKKLKKEVNKSGLKKLMAFIEEIEKTKTYIEDGVSWKLRAATTVHAGTIFSYNDALYYQSYNLGDGGSDVFTLGNGTFKKGFSSKRMSQPEGIKDRTPAFYGDVIAQNDLDQIKAHQEYLMTNWAYDLLKFYMAIGETNIFEELLSALVKLSTMQPKQNSDYVSFDPMANEGLFITLRRCGFFVCNDDDVYHHPFSHVTNGIDSQGQHKKPILSEITPLEAGQFIFEASDGFWDNVTYDEVIYLLNLCRTLTLCDKAYPFNFENVFKHNIWTLWNQMDRIFFQRVLEELVGKDDITAYDVKKVMLNFAATKMMMYSYIHKKMKYLFEKQKTKPLNEKERKHFEALLNARSKPDNITLIVNKVLA